MSLSERILGLLVRGGLTSSDDKHPMRYVQASVFDGELEDDIEHFEPYGFTSRALNGAEVLLAHLDGDRSHPIAAIITDRRYRKKDLKPGEVAIFDHRGNHIWIAEDGLHVEATSLPVTVHTSGTVTLDCPKVHITGDVKVDGDVVASGVSLVNHTHGGVESGGSSTSKPNK